MRSKRPSRAKPKQTAQPLPSPETLTINRASDEGAGIAKNKAGQTVFVSGALQGELVNATYTKQQKQIMFAKTTEVIEPSDTRIEPQCKYYAQCGGCQHQHMQYSTSVEIKKAALQNKLSKALAQEIPELDALTMHPFAYRRITRLALKWDDKAQCVNLGFRQESSNLITSIDNCRLLEDELNIALKALFENKEELFDIAARKRQLGHLVLMKTQEQVLCLITLAKSVAPDIIVRWQDFANEHDLKLYIQQENQTLEQKNKLDTSLPYLKVRQTHSLQVKPNDFIQVHSILNDLMIEQVENWLEELQPKRVFDLFCGLGNFTIPISTHAEQVLGFEVGQQMVNQARNNATLNNCNNISVYTTDLMADEGIDLLKQQPKADVIVLDPPRAGAKAVCENIKALKPQAIIYISCDANTFSRDAKALAQNGYELKALKLVDMFAQTSHFETMGLFVKSKKKVIGPKPIRNKYRA